MKKLVVESSTMLGTNMGDSLVDQYPSMLVHIAGFKFLKNKANILHVLGRMRGLRRRVRGVYKD